MSDGYWSRILKSRIDRRRGLASAGATALGAAFLVACGGDDGDGDADSGVVTDPVDTTKQAKRGGAVKHYQPGEATNFDPTVANALNTPSMQVYSHLVEYEPGYLEPTEYAVMPGVAESWETSPDKLTITLKLRSGVRWHNKPPVNGRALEADDIIRQWSRFAASSGFRMDLVSSANPDAPFESLTSPDPRTVVLKLKYPTAYALQALASEWVFPLVPREVETGLDIRRDMIGTGPYVLTKHEPSVGFTFSRNPEYFDSTRPYADSVEMPILTEYAAQLSQFIAGNIHTLSVNGGGIRGEDVLSTKQQVPEINVYTGDLAFDIRVTGNVAFGWLPDGAPWLDERVRQAYSMTWDRDLFLDTIFNVSKFEAEGLPVESRWNTSGYAIWHGFWLDPKSRDFGENAKYYQHNLAEAKQLLAAAGYANGFEYKSTYPAANIYGAAFPQYVEVLEGFAREAGFKSAVTTNDYFAEFIPKFRNAKGQHEGIAYKVGAGFASDAIARDVYEYYSRGGVNFYGFSTTGRNDMAGDPQVDLLIEKARAELDNEKRKVLAADIQRYLAKRMYFIRFPGTATGFEVAWPALRNFRVHQSMALYQSAYWWLDDSKAPLSRS